VIQSQKTQRHLSIRDTPATAPPTVQNYLGVFVKQLVLRASNGELYGAKDIPPDGQVQLEAVSDEDATRALKQYYNAAKMDFPVGYDASYYRNNFGFNNRYYGPWSDVDQNYPEASADLSLLERNLREAVQSGTEKLPARSYVAITSEGVEVPLGYRRAREEASLHLIRGDW
jgi:hypothetical protein